MPKIKTKKALVKKVKVTGSGKITRRHSNQNHYNSKQTGNTKRAKRGTQLVSPGEAKNITKAITC